MNKTKPSQGIAHPGLIILVIAEWGVRFELPEDLKGDIYYAPDEARPNTVIVDSREFPKGAECVSFGLTRTGESVNNPTDPDGFNSSSVTKIGNYYYARITGVIACSGDDAVQSSAAAIQRQLYDAAGLIEGVQQE